MNSRFIEMHDNMKKEIKGIVGEMTEVVNAEHSKATAKARIILDTLISMNTMLDTAKVNNKISEFKEIYAKWLKTAEESILFDVRAIRLLESKKN